MTRIDVMDRAAELRRQRVPFVLATVVRAQSPTSARPGDCAVILSDGTIEGFVGGSCALTTVKAESLRVLSRESSALLIISPHSTQSDENDSDGEVIRAFNPCLSGGTLEMFLEPSLPEPTIVIYGDSPIAQALLDAAAVVGFRPLEGTFMGSKELESDFVVIATHGIDEEPALIEALESKASYIGLVASRRRGAGVLSLLEDKGYDLSRIKSPAGLDIGGRTPGEIAISILAEIVTRRNSRSHRAETLAPNYPQIGIDPICGMDVVIDASAITVNLGGIDYYFCCNGCRVNFQKQHS